MTILEALKIGTKRYFCLRERCGGCKCYIGANKRCPYHTYTDEDILSDKIIRILIRAGKFDRKE